MHRRALLYEQTTNRFLDTLRSGPRPPYALAPETELAERYGVSRSTVRKVVLRLKTLGIVRVKRRKKTVVRKPAKKDYFPVRYDTPASRETAERFVLRKLTSRELPPEARFSELELANEAGCGRGAVREALIRISRFGLIEKTPRQQWRVIALDEARINELMQMH